MSKKLHVNVRQGKVNQTLISVGAVRHLTGDGANFALICEDENGIYLQPVKVLDASKLFVPENGSARIQSKKLQDRLAVGKHDCQWDELANVLRISHPVRPE